MRSSMKRHIACDLDPVLKEMRRAWNERAVENAEYYVFTRARSREEFDASGKVCFDKIVRPYLPVLLRGRCPRECRVAEIGCGLGRMTEWFAREFEKVHAIDVSTEMLAKAGERLSGFKNVVLHAGSGMDLAPLQDGYFDLAFSYLVFQHIPSREVVRNYILEAGRILKPGGAFHFQLNGYLSPDANPQKDTWRGESFSFSEAVDMLRAAGLAPFNAVGAGTQYFILSARRISSELQPLSSFAQSESTFWLANLEQECARLDRELARSAKRIAQLLARGHSLNGQVKEKSSWAECLKLDVEKARSDLAQLRTEFEERTAWALSLCDDVEEARNAWSHSKEQLKQFSATLRSAQENPWPLVKSKIKQTVWSLLKRLHISIRSLALYHLTLGSGLLSASDLSPCILG